MYEVHCTRGKSSGTYVVFEFLKLSSRAGGGDRGDGCCDTATICGFGDDIDAIGIKSDDIFSMCSRSPIIGSLQSTILMPMLEYAVLLPIDVLSTSSFTAICD